MFGTLNYNVLRRAGRFNKRVHLSPREVNIYEYGGPEAEVTKGLGSYVPIRVTMKVLTSLILVNVSYRNLASSTISLT